jgi:hypothetical protein
MTRECSETCEHYDNINRCCWQSGPWGLCFDVDEDDICHLGYKDPFGEQEDEEGGW